MGTRSIRFGSQLTFDEDKEKDIIDTIDSLNSSGNQSQDEAVSRQVQSPPSALSFQSAQNIPILPSYIDREGVDEKSVIGSE